MTFSQRQLLLRISDEEEYGYPVFVKGCDLRSAKVLVDMGMIRWFTGRPRFYKTTKKGRRHANDIELPKCRPW